MYGLCCAGYRIPMTNIADVGGGGIGSRILESDRLPVALVSKITGFNKVTPPSHRPTPNIAQMGGDREGGGLLAPTVPTACLCVAMLRSHPDGPSSSMGAEPGSEATPRPRRGPVAREAGRWIAHRLPWGTLPPPVVAPGSQVAPPLPPPPEASAGCVVMGCPR